VDTRISRRTLLSGAAALAACSRKGKGFPGYAFVANQDGRSVAAVDLSAFTLARQIALNGAPNTVVAHPARPTVYVLTPENGTIFEIEAATLAVKRRVRPAQSAVSMRLAGDGRSLWLLAREPRALLRVPLDTLRAGTRIPLPQDPDGFELDPRPEGRLAGVSFPNEGAVALCDLAAGTATAPLHVGPRPLVAGFRKDGQLLIAGSADRTMTMFDVPSGKTVVRLPLPLEPAHFCFLPDGGQLFVTGPGMDGVVIVLPFSTEVGETILAGRAPGAMATWTPQEPQPYSYLFVANPETADVTVIDIDTRKLVVVLHTGGAPSQILFTPDNRYALVLNNRSGDLAVVRTAEFTTEKTKWIERYKTGALFTVIPVGGRPVGAAVVSAG
jgi:DNA-binding beta-propeller fold protein YncE